MTINSLHTLTVDGTTLALTQWDGIEQLRLSVAPIGKPSAVIEVTLAHAVDMAKAILRHAGYSVPVTDHVEPPPPAVDHAEESLRRHLEHGERERLRLHGEQTEHAARRRGRPPKHAA